jgi:hypothetical protein
MPAEDMVESSKSEDFAQLSDCHIAKTDSSCFLHGFPLLF